MQFAFAALSQYVNSFTISAKLTLSWTKSATAAGSSYDFKLAYAGNGWYVN